MNRGLVVDVVERLPQALVSRAWGWLARRSQPRVAVALFKRLFVTAAGIDMSEARDPIGSYGSVEQLFVRELRPGARRVDPDPAAVVSPVDARVGACGTVEGGTLLQVKGRSYGLSRLLGDDEQAKRFEGGAYATLYLSPRDYHRIHAPVSGQVTDAALIPGRLMPVFPEAVERVDELFARNERVVTYLDSPDAGRVAVVKVGATMVGRITVAYDDSVRTNAGETSARALHYDPPRLLQKGSHLGTFELGSTVVLLTEPGRVRLDGLTPDGRTRMGGRIGTVAGRARRGATGKSPPKTRKRAPGSRKRKSRTKEKA
jgi:phosphatidylserine decarboxylase